MNKLVKGAIATAAAAMLLTGGAGTFASWNASVGVTGATITAGNLVVTDATPSNGVWTVQKNGIGTALTVANISTFTASPGDKLTYAKTVTFTATGDNLTATLALGAGSIAGAGSTPTAASTALALYLTKTAAITASGTGVTAGSAAGTYLITPLAAGVTTRNVDIVVVINFPKDAVQGAENTTKLGSVTLSGLTVTLDQQ
ncbi:MAG: alternate-type signal peptide domain-containing protein [Salinibacterium sp.]|nr:alternate-type signal peptide domain-containing protein [Salinibacterium sp.]